MRKNNFTRVMHHHTLHVFMDLLLNYPEAVSIKFLASRSGVSRNVVGRAVDYLVDAGFAVRTSRYSVAMLRASVEEFLHMLPVDNLSKPVDNFSPRGYGMHNNSASDAQKSSIAHDHDPDDDHHTYDKEDLIERLKKLVPPFDGAAAFVERRSNNMIGAWLDHYDQLPLRARKKINSAPAFINAKVRLGEFPNVASVVVCEQCSEILSEQTQQLNKYRDGDLCLNCRYRKTG